MAVGDGNSSGSHNGINEPISAVAHGNMVNPNFTGAIDWNPITVALCPKTIMGLTVSDHPTFSLEDVEDLNPVNDHILDKLDGDASSSGDDNSGSSAIDGLIASHNQLLLEPNHHAVLEDDPQGTSACDCMAKGTYFGVNQIIIWGVCDHVVWTTLSSNSAFSEA